MPAIVCRCACHPLEVTAPVCGGCRCPACKLPALYAHESKEHACQDPECKGASGRTPDDVISRVLDILRADISGTGRRFS